MSATVEDWARLARAQNMAARILVSDPSLKERNFEMSEFLNKPAQDFKNMLLNPVMEEITLAMAPLRRSLQPILQDIFSLVITIFKPIIIIFFKIVEASGPFIQQVSRLLGWEGKEDTIAQSEEDLRERLRI